MPGYNEVADIDVINGNMDKIDVQMKKNADSAQQSKDIVSDKYSATNTYAVVSYCIHENALYKCKTAITTGEAFDSNKWVQTTCGREFGELNSNLSQLEYSEVAGGKNLFDGKFINKLIDVGGNYTQRNLKEEFGLINNLNGIIYTTFGGYFKKGTYTFSYTNDAWFSLNRIAIAGTNCIGVTQSIRKSYTWTQNVDGWTYFGIEGDDSETGVVDTPFSITPDIMIEKGSTATTPYEPYIPSVKMLAEEVSAQNESLDVLQYGDTHGGYNIFKDTTWFVGRHMAENGINDYHETGSAYSDYISIVEPNTYYISSSTHPKSTVFEYDTNKSFIKYNGWKKDHNTPCVLSGNCA